MLANGPDPLLSPQTAQGNRVLRLKKVSDVKIDIYGHKGEPCTLLPLAADGKAAREQLILDRL